MKYSLILLAALTAMSGRAAAVEMSTQTCQDWLDASEDEQDQMVAWLRGYLSGRATSTVYEMAKARADATTLKAYCQNHKDTGVVSAASQWGK